MQLTATKKIAFEISVKGKKTPFNVIDKWNGFFKLEDDCGRTLFVTSEKEGSLSSGITQMFDGMFQRPDADNVGLLVIKGTPSLLAELQEVESGPQAK